MKFILFEVICEDGEIKYAKPNGAFIPCNHSADACVQCTTGHLLSHFREALERRNEWRDFASDESKGPRYGDGREDVKCPANRLNWEMADSEARGCALFALDMAQAYGREESFANMLKEWCQEIMGGDWDHMYHMGRPKRWGGDGEVDDAD